MCIDVYIYISTYVRTMCCFCLMCGLGQGNQGAQYPLIEEGSLVHIGDPSTIHSIFFA